MDFKGFEQITPEFGIKQINKSEFLKVRKNTIRLPSKYIHRFGISKDSKTAVFIYYNRTKKALRFVKAPNKDALGAYILEIPKGAHHVSPLIRFPSALKRLGLERGIYTPHHELPDTFVFNKAYVPKIKLKD
jgi:hypothetical protein